MRIVRRHYKASAPHYGLLVWRIRGYLAFDFHWGKHLFVLGFSTGGHY